MPAFDATQAARRFAAMEAANADRPVIDRFSMLPIGQYGDGSLTFADPGILHPALEWGREQFRQGSHDDLMTGMPAATHIARTVMDPWGTAKNVASSAYDFLLRPSIEGAARSAVAQEGAPVYDDGGQYVSGAIARPEDAFMAASIAPMGAFGARATGLTRDVGDLGMFAGRGAKTYNHVEFTPEMREFIKERYPTTSSEILAEQLGVAEPTLRKFIRSGDAGVELRSPGDNPAKIARRAKIDEMGGHEGVMKAINERGLKVIAEELGLGVESLRAIMQKRGLMEKVGRNAKPDRNARIIELTKQGYMPAEIAREMGDGLTRGAVTAALNRARKGGLFANDSRASLPALTANAVEKPQGIRAYHGTTASFDRFDPGFAGRDDIGVHFGSPEQAAVRASGARTSYGKPPTTAEMPDGARIIPADIYPERLATLGDDILSDPHAAAAEFGRQGLIPADLVEAITSQPIGSPGAKDLLQTGLKMAGVDVVRYPNKFEGVGDSYAVLAPGRVRSATTGEIIFANSSTASLPSLLMNAEDGQQPTTSDIARLYESYLRGGQ